jgi:uncharacterized delta-60 repeat protein
VEVGADGKIVVAFETLPLHGDILTVARFNTDGSPDTDFGERGRASELVGHGFDVTALRVLDDGKILVGVRVFSPGGTYDGGVPFNPDGSLDSSSPRAAVAPEDPGLGRIAPFDVRVPDPFAPGVSKAAEARSPARAAATQADGKIVALAQAAVDGAVFDLDLAVLRFNADGTPDPTFAHAVHFPGDPDTYAIAVQPGTGRILYAQGDHFAVVGLASGPPLDAPR